MDRSGDEGAGPKVAESAPEGTKRVLVTGGTGTLGRHVVRLLRTAGHDVRVLSHSGAPDTFAGDLRTGSGLSAALDGIEVVVHCASSPTRPKEVDVAGTQRLLEAAALASVGHVVYPSIVGIERNQGLPLYRAKLVAERAITGGPVPWTIQRATQFHELIRSLLGALDRLPVVLPVPRGFVVQPVASVEVAARMVELVSGPPAGRVSELGGPEVRSLASLAATYLQHQGRDKRVIEVPLPGAAARGFRAGAQLVVNGELGSVTWARFLESQQS